MKRVTPLHILKSIISTAIREDSVYGSFPLIERYYVHDWTSSQFDVIWRRCRIYNRHLSPEFETWQISLWVTVCDISSSVAQECESQYNFNHSGNKQILKKVNTPPLPFDCNLWDNEIL